MSKKVPNEILKCDSCGLQVLDKAEHPDWKGIPMKPNTVEMKWFCREKEPCEKAFQRAMVEAERAWGNE